MGVPWRGGASIGHARARMDVSIRDRARACQGGEHLAHRVQAGKWHGRPLWPLMFMDGDVLMAHPTGEDA